MSSKVQIEVIDEEEYELEVQREREEKSRRREEERRKLATAATATAGAAAGASSNAQAAAAQPHAAVAASVPTTTAATRFTTLLAPLSLPPFIATLHDARVYDPASFARQSAQVPSFHRTATQAWRALLVALDALPAEAGGERAAALQLRPVLTPLLCACIRFLLPPLPPAPAPLVPPHLLQDRDEDTLPPSLESQAPPFEFVWQTPALTELALQGLQKLAQLHRSDWEASTDAIPARDPAAAQAAAVGSVEAVLSDPSIQRFLALVLPTHLLPFLRQEMRSGSGSVGPASASAAAGTAAADAAAPDNGTNLEWKSPAHFPAPFFVSFLCAYLDPSILSEHLRSLLPLLLPLLDDHEMHLKVVGLVSLQRLVRFVPAAQLGEGWGALLLRSLKTALSIREAPVLSLAVPTFVQTYMLLYPPVLLHDESVLQQLQPMGGAAAAVAAAGSTHLQQRAAAHDELMGALLHELSYLLLSPTLDNLFATFVYAQSLLPALLYVGPAVVLRHMRTLLPVLVQWCTHFTSPVQRRVCKLSWECVEALLCMSALGERLAEQHLGRLVEACAQGWMAEADIDADIDARLRKHRRAPSARPQPQPQPQSQPPRTDAVPLSDPSFHLHYSARPTIVHVLRLLRQRAPERFASVWRELHDLTELADLDRALNAHS